MGHHMWGFGGNPYYNYSKNFTIYTTKKLNKDAQFHRSRNYKEWKRNCRNNTTLIFTIFLQLCNEWFSQAQKNSSNLKSPQKKLSQLASTISLLPAPTLRWRLLPRLPGPRLTGGFTIAGIGGGGDGGGGEGGGGERAIEAGGAKRASTSLWYFCRQEKDFDHAGRWMRE